METLCITDPESEGRSLAKHNGVDEDDDHRMMASTTVFVIEPGVTALGRETWKNSGVTHIK